MKALKSLLFGFLGAILAFNAMIILYAKVPGFHDFLHSAINEGDAASESASLNPLSDEGVLSTDDVESIDIPTAENEEAVLSEEVNIANSVAMDDNAIPVVNKTTYSIGDNVQIDGLIANLVYVKRMDYYPSGLGEKEVTDGNEVILFFFDIYNSGNKGDFINQMSFKGYADGTLISDTDTIVGIVADDICQADLAYYLYPTTKAMDIIEFEAPKGWNKFNLFYSSLDGEAAWEISSDEVSSEPYVFNPVINVDVQRTATHEGDIVYDGDDFRLTYLGHESDAHTDPIFVANPSYYEYFYFRIDNKKDTKFRLGFRSIDLMAYADNYAMDAAVPFGETRNNYYDIYHINEIEPGMSADVFAGFSKTILDPETNNFYVVFPLTDEGQKGDVAEIYIE